MLSFSIVNYTCLDILFLVHDFQSFLCITLFEVLCTHWKLLHKNIALMYADQFHPLIISKTRKHSRRMCTAYLPTVCVVVASVGWGWLSQVPHCGYAHPQTYQTQNPEGTWDQACTPPGRDMGPCIPTEPPRQTDNNENTASPKTPLQAVINTDLR